MAEFYKREGKCADEDESVCKSEGHYVLSEEEADIIEENLENWAKAFELAG